MADLTKRRQPSVPRPRKETDYSRSVTTARVTIELKEFVENQGRYDESFDQILRRLLKFPRGGRTAKRGGTRAKVGA